LPISGDREIDDLHTERIMAKGIALHIGLNSVDPHKYEGWSGPLSACEADANDMATWRARKDSPPQSFSPRRPRAPQC